MVEPADVHRQCGGSRSPRRHLLRRSGTPGMLELTPTSPPPPRNTSPGCCSPLRSVTNRSRSCCAGCPAPMWAVRWSCWQSTAICSPPEPLQATIDLTPKQRDGVIGTAQPWVSFLRNPTYLPWIERTGPDDDRPQFDPHSFVRSHATRSISSPRREKGSACDHRSADHGHARCARQARRRLAGDAAASPISGHPR